MGCKLTSGRFQKMFFEMMRQMLSDEDNRYYDLIKDVIYHISIERMVRYGMNVGYNACTKGAERIRKIEHKEGFNIPWSLIDKIDGNTFEENYDGYKRKILEGRELGIFMYQILVDTDIAQVLPLVEEFDDCAFLIYCTPDQITEEVLEFAANHYQLAIAIVTDENFDSDQLHRVCQQMRTRQLIYGFCYVYSEDEYVSIVDGDITSDLIEFHPCSIIFRQGTDVREETQKKVYAQILAERNKPHYPVIPMEFTGDNCFFNSMITENVQIDYAKLDGTIHFLDGREINVDNLLNTPLEDTLKSISDDKAMVTNSVYNL